jgi:hypothetical protein
MSHIFQLSDEQYAKLATYAAQRKQTPETLFQAWVNDLIHALEEQTLSMSIEQEDQEEQEVSEEELLNSPLFRLAGVFSFDVPDRADRYDVNVAEAYTDDHAEEE